MTSDLSPAQSAPNTHTDAKRNIKRLLLLIVVANTVAFLALAVVGQLSVEGKALVFVDFWGRVTVYSLWFICYAAYRKWAQPIPVLRTLIVTVVLANIPAFLLLAFFDKISNAPNTLVFVDFWGRLTAYSVWFIAYETYRVHVADDRSSVAI